MAATKTSNEITLGKDWSAPKSANEIMCAEATVDLTATATITNTWRMIELPEACVPVDVVLIDEGLDAHATPTLKFTVGVLNTAYTALESNSQWINSASATQNGTLIRANSHLGFENFTPSRTAKKQIGVYVAATAATHASESATLRVLYRAAIGTDY